ncbi:hypothetical protein GOV05_01875 [Candidatus Woesearchaeota archaeon]|nr:hypothetical protein [Candidatus Woesearchaeota archaeon]
MSDSKASLEQQKTTVLREEVVNLRKILNNIDEDKEKVFSEKTNVSKQISDLIKGVKDDKRSRDLKTRSVSDLKKKRKEFNEVIKEKIALVKVLNEKKAELVKNRGSGSKNPKLLKKEIDKLEFHIETEAMGYEKEQKLMKQINSMREEYKKLSVSNSVFDDSKNLSKEIDKLKKEADAVHKKIVVCADESQALHEGLILKSNEIDELKKKEEESYKVFLAKKDEFSSVNEKLKKKLSELSALTERIIVKKKEKKKEKKSLEKKVIKEKTQDVEEKIKKGAKLTTQDLLLFQANNSDSEKEEKEEKK